MSNFPETEKRKAAKQRRLISAARLLLRLLILSTTSIQLLLLTSHWPELSQAFLQREGRKYTILAVQEKLWFCKYEVEIWIWVGNQILPQHVTLVLLYHFSLSSHLLNLLSLFILSEMIINYQTFFSLVFSLQDPLYYSSSL